MQKEDNERLLGHYDNFYLGDFFMWDPEGKPDPIDVKHAERKKRIDEAKSLFEHNCNALNLVYCRTRDILSFLGKYEYFFSSEDRNKEIAKFIGKSYEKNVYNGNGGSRLSKGLKSLKDIFSHAKSGL